MSDLVERLRAAGCVFAEDEAKVLAASARDSEQLEAWVRRRVAGEPLEYVVGWAAFAGLRIAVERGVFVPRRRSEHLAAEAVARTPEAGIVVDLCCGSGALAAAVRADRPGAQVWASDRDPVAVRCARRNLPSARVVQGDLFGALPHRLRGRVDVVVANAPYVPSGAVALLPAEAREHEPRHTLDGGGDGLTLARRIAGEAGTWLAPGGHLLIETGREQAADLARGFTAHGLVAQVTTDDERDATAVIGSS